MMPHVPTGFRPPLSIVVEPDGKAVTIQLAGDAAESGSIHIEGIAGKEARWIPADQQPEVLLNALLNDRASAPRSSKERLRGPLKSRPDWFMHFVDLVLVHGRLEIGNKYKGNVVTRGISIEALKACWLSPFHAATDLSAWSIKKGEDNRVLMAFGGAWCGSTTDKSKKTLPHFFMMPCLQTSWDALKRPTIRNSR
jgi:hypothetical protein